MENVWKKWPENKPAKDGKYIIIFISDDEEANYWLKNYPEILEYKQEMWTEECEFDIISGPQTMNRTNEKFWWTEIPPAPEG